MSSLIGNKPNQVPTNGDLGSAAYVDIDRFYQSNTSASNRNRIINGDMRIDQRNAGASASFGSYGYVLDRWNQVKNSGSAGTIQQSSTAPVGFKNSMLVTNNATGVTPSAGDSNRIQTRIEGNNISDLEFGTSDAKTITLSFWVRSSLTGTYGVGFSNSAFDRSYVATYTISSANTWEQKTITLTGDTTGTWLDNTGSGIAISFDLGSGTDNNGTANAWQAGTKYRTSGCVNWVGTGGATFYITGVQLEAGSVATPFEHRQYGQELALCQRYYYKVAGDGVDADLLGLMWCISSTRADGWTPFPVTMRTSPTALEQTGTASDYTVATLATGITCSAVPVFVRANLNGARTQATVSSGLTAGNGCSITSQPTGTGYLAWSAEL